MERQPAEISRRDWHFAAGLKTSIRDGLLCGKSSHDAVFVLQLMPVDEAG